MPTRILNQRVRPQAASGWGRGKLVGLLTGALIAALLLVLGLMLGVYYTLQPAGHASARSIPPTIAATSGTGASASAVLDPARGAQDRLAAAVMPTVDLSASQPGPVSTRDPGVLVVPPATRVGPAGVPTGFPHTAGGALAQLAAIDQSALQSGTLAGVREVIGPWAAAGGPTATTWSAVAAMRQFLDAAGLSGGGSAQLALVVTPLMGLIKGTVGSDFVIPCVDFEVDATLTATGRVAVADCQRMSWAGTRWVIGPGSEPATPPSVWADTDTAIAVGYRDLRRG